ncbi:MAG: cohesin domain-containing protein, partial [Chloroflexota bacterium]
AYAGLEVRIRFYFYTPNYQTANRWYIDDVRIDEVDTTAPAAITNLSVSSATADSATLAWTAPGDDAGTGRARQYDIRYSTSPMTATNWDTATKAAAPPAPQPAGTRETFTVTRLNSLTTYYFAIKTADEVANWSGLSNEASGTTFPAGAVIVTADAPTYVLTQRDFSAKVKLNQVDNFDAASYNIVFNPAVLQVANVTAGLIGGTQIPVGQWNVVSSGNVSIVQNVDGTPGISGTGYLAVLRFHVIGASSTASQISLTGGTLGDKDAHEIPSSWVADSVLVTSVLPGDANGDEVVNALDLTATERIIVGLDAATPGADANKDGNVNALDLTLIERIIVGLQ